MVYEPKCECFIYSEIEIKSFSQYEEIESFFSLNIEKHNFIEFKPSLPYYSFGEKFWYADKWHKCKICGCLWEYKKPDFPASGFVRKFQDGVYLTRGY